VLDHETALGNMRGEAQVHHLGATGGAPWDNAWWYLSRPLLTGLGPIGLALGSLGLAITARRREAAAMLLPVLLGFFVLLCLQHLVWERWALALMPILAIAASLGLTTLENLLIRHAPASPARAAIVLLGAVALLPPALHAATDTRARLNDTRQLASHWARENIPAGSSILLESFAFDILPQPWHFLFPFGDVGCVDVREYLGGKVQLSTVQAGRGSRTNVDYGTVAPVKRETCRSDYAILTQADRYAAERSAFPEQDAAYRALIARGTVMTSFFPQDGKVGGPIVRVVRFQR
jgi:hypothetical protein